MCAVEGRRRLPYFVFGSDRMSKWKIERIIKRGEGKGGA
jgi:hypothetical protein